MTAADGGSGVAGVDFFECSNGSTGCAGGGGTWNAIGTDTTAPYSVAWPLPGDGNRALKAVVSDRAGHTATAVTNVVVDQTAPTGTLTSPGPFLRGSVALAAAAADATSGVSSVDFQSSPAGAGTWTTIAQATSSPYGATLDTTGLGGDGPYDLRVFVTDKAGNVFVHQPAAPVLVDNTPPTVAMTAPPAYVSAGTTLASTQSDAGSGIDTVAFEYRAVGAPTWTVTPAALDTSALPEGRYEVRTVVLTGPATRPTPPTASPRTSTTRSR